MTSARQDSQRQEAGRWRRPTTALTHHKTWNKRSCQQAVMSTRTRPAGTNLPAGLSEACWTFWDDSYQLYVESLFFFLWKCNCVNSWYVTSSICGCVELQVSCRPSVCHSQVCCSAATWCFTSTVFVWLEGTTERPRRRVWLDENTVKQRVPERHKLNEWTTDAFLWVYDT